MFSQDPKHYRSTPRTTQQAFGPYSRAHFENRKHERGGMLFTLLAIVVIGVYFGLLLAWRG